MKNNEGFEQIINAVKKSNNILILPHILPDGDTIGSSVALCRALKKYGKQVYLLTEGKVPGYLDFLVKDCPQAIPNSMKFDLTISIDCSDQGSLGKRLEIFKDTEVTINLDHHRTNDLYANYNYVDDKAAATGEIIFDLISELKIDFDKKIAEAIYSAISTDTGSFKYSNTSSKTHLIAAELLKMGIDTNKINVELYQNIRIEQIRLEAEVLKTLEISHNGKVASAYVSQDMLTKTGSTIDETEGLIEVLRNIQGVEIAILLKEMSEREIKIGLRAKKVADVSRIATQFGGGGHIKAAGCSIKDTMENAKLQISEAAIKYMKEHKICQTVL